MKLPLSRFFLLILLALSVGGFCWLQQTTPERIGALIFFVLISLYAFFAHRDDVLAVSTLFFTLLDINYYLFDQILPIWIGIIVIVAVAALLWLILFGRTGWIMAVASILGILELAIATQYINISFPLQALLVSSPFAYIMQQYYIDSVSGSLV